MLWTITKKEILEQFISLRFILLNIICIILFPLAFFVNHQDYEKRVSDYNLSVRLHQEKMDNIKLVETVSEAFSMDGYHPPSPLSIFATGLNYATPQILSAKRTGLIFQSKGYRNESILNLVGKLDLMFIVQTIFSIIAILFTFDALCGEKEKGTLRAALSNSVPRDTYILGKYLGTMFTLLLPFIVSCLLGLILLVVLGFPFSSNELLLRILLIIISSIFHISIYCCIGLFVSSRVESSKTSIVVLLLIWIFMIFIIPKVSNIVAKVFRTVRSEEVFQQERSLMRHDLELVKGRLIDEVNKSLPVDRTLNTEKQEQIYRERWKLTEPIRDEYRKIMKETSQKIEQDYALEKARQSSLAISLARVSPSTSFTRIMTDLAWTGEHASQKFIASAQAYQTVMERELFKYIIRDILPGRGSGGGIAVSDDFNLKELPTFQYERASLPETLESISLDVVFTFFFTIFFFVLVYVSFLKYDVR